MVASVVEFRQNGYSTRYPTTPIRVPRAKEKLFKDLTAAYRKLHEQNEADELFQAVSDILYSFCDRQGERVILSPQELEALEQQRLEEEAQKQREFEETRQRLEEEQRQRAEAEANLAAMRERLLLEEAAKLEAERERQRLEQEKEEARALAEREAAARQEAELERQRWEQEKEEASRREAEAVELAEARARQELQQKEVTVVEAQSLAAKEAASRSQLEVTVKELQEQLNAVRLQFTEKNILLEQQVAELKELKELKELLGIADQDIAVLKRENAELRSQLAKNEPPNQTPPSQRGSGKSK